MLEERNVGSNNRNGLSDKIIVEWSKEWGVIVLSIEDWEWLNSIVDITSAESGQ